MNPEQQGKTYPALPAAPVAVGGCHLRWPRRLAAAVGDGTGRPPTRTTNAGRQRSSPWPAKLNPTIENRKIRANHHDFLSESPE